MDIALLLLQRTPITGPGTGEVFATVFITILGVLMVIIVALVVVHDHRKDRGGLPGLLGPWRLEGSPPADATEPEEPLPR